MSSRAIGSSFIVAASVAALLAAPTAGTGAQAPATQAGFPAVWLHVGEGLGLVQAKASYQSTIVHTPMVGAGMRIAPRIGLEGSLVWSQSFDSGEDVSVGDPRPLPPNYSGISASVLRISGTPRVPFSSAIGGGAGLYKEHGAAGSSIGVHGLIESAMKATDSGTLSGAFRITALLDSEAGKSYTVALTFQFRTAKRTQ